MNYEMKTPHLRRWGVQVASSDYGIDVYLETFDENGGFEGEHIPLQIKATDAIRDCLLISENSFSIAVDTKDYRLWRTLIMPVFLILYDPELEEAYWLHIQEYDTIVKPVLKGKTINVRIPSVQILGVQVFHLMRQRKLNAIELWKRSANKGDA